MWNPSAYREEQAARHFKANVLSKVRRVWKEKASQSASNRFWKLEKLTNESVAVLKRLSCCK